MTHNLILSKETHQSFGFTVGSIVPPSERVGWWCVFQHVCVACICALSSGEEGNGIICSDQWSWKLPIRWFDKQQGRPLRYIAGRGVGMRAFGCVRVNWNMSAWNFVCVGNQIEKENGNSSEMVCACAHARVCVLIHKIKRDNVYTAHPCIATITHALVRDRKPLYKHPSLPCNDSSEEHQHIVLPLLLLLCIRRFFTCAPLGEKQHKTKMRPLTSEQGNEKRNHVGEHNEASQFYFEMENSLGRKKKISGVIIRGPHW